MTIQANNTLGTIVKQHHLTAHILEKYQLDFCCKGKQTLEEACAHNQLDLNIVLADLQQVSLDEQQQAPQTESMNVEELISVIIRKHHLYVLQQGASIQHHLQKVASKHGDKFPYMIKVWEVFMPALAHLHDHMQKEEQILFPRIRDVYAASKKKQTTLFSPAYLQAPIAAMEAEHDDAGDAFAQIRVLTNNYAIPEGACNTFSLLLMELQDFEADLHRHVHLENHVLFPAALQLMAAN
ncbi:iron-sulfur cluster repair di-iron protein [Phnomibacter ginsenosidimutans]|uniref:Iron-sulfur cluster repair di-iron protein n=1 Tax=Phnomibacter ginsenosidimutans TaxID=2676868 RepID=A0A6I6GDN2_9BACT|nr:iron-sulfur cluster repair di-iron protein [Phnomibacter ginsenosidimutans]QGW28440.1 iron-sulfur cluster repair di-iron protein [Phnomibacter ginsenosidimutans]